MALLLKTHHAFLQPCEPFARSSIPILRVLGNGPLKAQGDTARQAKSRLAQYSDASPILQLHANGKHHTDVRRRCPLYPPKSGHWNSAVKCPLCAQKRTFVLVQATCAFTPTSDIGRAHATGAAKSVPAWAYRLTAVIFRGKIVFSHQREVVR